MIRSHFSKGMQTFWLSIRLQEIQIAHFHARFGVQHLFEMIWKVLPLVPSTVAHLSCSCGWYVMSVEIDPKYSDFDAWQGQNFPTHLESVSHGHQTGLKCVKCWLQTFFPFIFDDIKVFREHGSILVGIKVLTLHLFFSFFFEFFWFSCFLRKI